MDFQYSHDFTLEWSEKKKITPPDFTVFKLHESGFMLNKKLHLMQRIVIGPQLQKFIAAFFLGRRASQSFDCNSKICKNKFFQKCFLCLNLLFSLIFLKQKIKRIEKIVFPCTDQKQFSHFWKILKLNFIFGDCYFMYCKRKVSANFHFFIFILRSL